MVHVACMDEGQENLLQRPLPNVLASGVPFEKERVEVFTPEAAVAPGADAIAGQDGCICPVAYRVGMHAEHDGRLGGGQ